MISIIIPAANEEKIIGNSLEKLSVFLATRKEKFEVIVVDDASSDKTKQVAEKFHKKIPNLRVIRIEKSPSEGKGLAVNKGVLEAKEEIVIFTDADFSTPIEEIDKLLLKLKEGFDIAIGSRALNRSLVKTKQNFLRELMGKIFNFLVQRIVVRGIVDTQCGFKAFKMPLSRELFEREKIFDFGFDVELLYLARKRNLKIAEVPVLWYNHPSSKVHPIKDSISMFFDLFKIRMYHASKKGSLADKIFYQLYYRRTIWRFGLVGSSGTIIDYSLFFILTRFFHLSPLVANPMSVEAAIIWNFIWNNLWTFSERQVPRPLWKNFLIFQFVSLGGLLFSQNSLFIFNRVFNIFDLIAKALTIPMVASFNYLVNSRWTFRDVSAGRSTWQTYIIFILALFALYFLLIL
ncbi:MAG: hypothetical protein A2Z11_00090 [Candidatus Woykebacteria bacterium RBG_16_43_9]|uniref:dolichyl-phosphate beta-glucosyltransferase n=1 Tax=Candidatus Woykebacteria bacterium RBG_16_43_9 TaxID=1802596 RepID=A0A1G1WC16_9BACT|nr:MAG: hypothetical protein A2Z11_00090 [Candidatus Woykebacteria bacterium RBG_16_43_9]